MIKKLYILIIEDDKGLRSLLRAVLEKKYQLVCADSALMGMNWLYDNDNELPDLIIIDIDLPDISGMDMLEQMKNNAFFENIPLIALSSEKDQQIAARCYELGVEGYFVKPFNPDYLLLKVGEILSAKTSYA